MNRPKIRKTIATVLPHLVTASVAASITYLYLNHKTLLELPKEQADKMVKDGGCVIYETPSGNFMLKHI